MIALQEVVAIHEVLIQEFGGSPGLRDQNLLQSAMKDHLVGLEKLLFMPRLRQKQAQFWRA
jgi:death-on-curing protein